MSGSPEVQELVPCGIAPSTRTDSTRLKLFPLLPHTQRYIRRVNNESPQSFLHCIEFSPQLPDSCEPSINTGPNFIPHFSVKGIFSLVAVGLMLITPFIATATVGWKTLGS